MVIVSSEAGVAVNVSRRTTRWGLLTKISKPPTALETSGQRVMLGCGSHHGRRSLQAQKSATETATRMSVQTFLCEDCLEYPFKSSPDLVFAVGVRRGDLNETNVKGLQNGRRELRINASLDVGLAGKHDGGELQRRNRFWSRSICDAIHSSRCTYARPPPHAQTMTRLRRHSTRQARRSLERLQAISHGTLPKTNPMTECRPQAPAISDPWLGCGLSGRRDKYLSDISIAANNSQGGELTAKAPALRSGR